MRSHTRHGRWLVLTLFVVKNKTLPCFVDDYSKFPIVKKEDSLAADDLVKPAKIMFNEFELPNKVISDAGLNFISNTVRQFCRQMDIEQAIT